MVYLRPRAVANVAADVDHKDSVGRVYLHLVDAVERPLLRVGVPLLDAGLRRRVDRQREHDVAGERKDLVPAVELVLEAGGPAERDDHRLSLSRRIISRSDASRSATSMHRTDVSNPGSSGSRQIGSAPNPAGHIDRSGL